MALKIERELRCVGCEDWVVVIGGGAFDIGGEEVRGIEF